MLAATPAHLLLCVLLHLLLLLVAPVAVMARVTAVIVFGDSTVDAGNNNAVATVVRSNFPPYGRDFPGRRATGRFCNGRLATDFYSEAYGLRPFVPAYLDPDYGIRDFASGVCFASAGSGLDAATAGVFVRRPLCPVSIVFNTTESSVEEKGESVIPLWKQLDYFRDYKRRLAAHLGAAEAAAVVSDAVYAISVGTNDFIENYFALTTRRYQQFSVAEYTDYLVGLARSLLVELYGLGARKVAFTGLAAAGCLPLERARRGMLCAEEYNAAALGFNAALRRVVGELADDLPAAQLRFADVYDLFADMLGYPARYGKFHARSLSSLAAYVRGGLTSERFVKAEVGCCGSGTYEMGYTCSLWDARTCRDADRYVFWDAVHPTERANRIISEYLFNTTFSHFL
uniref:GDSL esterase/lipase n=1 Tax=Leersia perrieri TaxID=77586 RepID=A0A0D9VFQ0_9ORYZ